MRYAIVASGGKQYVAREGEILEIDRLDREAGQAFEFAEVLLAADGEQVLVGSPQVEGARVVATVEGTVRGKKVIVFRYQPKKRRRRKLGHRQSYTRLKIDQIEIPGVARSQQADVPKKAAPRKKAGAAARPKASGSRTPKSAGAVRKAAVKKTARAKKD